MHRVDQEQRAGTGSLGNLADLAQQVGEILLVIAWVREARGRFCVELELHSEGTATLNAFDHPKRALRSVLDAMAAAHLAQQTGGHTTVVSVEVV
jgi:hypothetical protein